MNTWTCKKVFAGLLLLAGTAGCDEVVGTRAFLAPTGGASAPPPTEVTLADGDVTVVAPDGYCVDPRSAQDDFALIARCDTLGGRSRLFSAPLALITISVAAGSEIAGAVESLPTEPEIIVGQVRTDDFTLVQISGPAPVPGASDRYWRGVGQVGGHAVGLALYAPKDTPELGNRGADLLVQVLRRSQAASGASAAPSESPAPRPAKKDFRDAIAALFQ